MLRSYRTTYVEIVMRSSTMRYLHYQVRDGAARGQPEADERCGWIHVLSPSSSSPTDKLVTTFICPQLLNEAPINPRHSSITAQMFVGLQTGQLAASMPASNYRVS